MNRLDSYAKRQLLADSLLGNTAGLRQYQRHRQRLDYPYRWIVNDTVANRVYGVGMDGRQVALTAEELAAAPSGTVWTVVDFSGGERIPELDEEYT